MTISIPSDSRSQPGRQGPLAVRVLHSAMHQGCSCVYVAVVRTSRIGSVPVGLHGIDYSDSADPRRPSTRCSHRV